MKNKLVGFVIIIILLMSTSCIFDRKVPPNSVSVRIICEDTIAICYLDSYVNITKFKTKQSNDTLYIYDIYVGEKPIRAVIPINQDVKYVSFSKERTFYVDSMKIRNEQTFLEWKNGTERGL